MHDHKKCSFLKLVTKQYKSFENKRESQEERDGKRGRTQEVRVTMVTFCMNLSLH